MVRVYLDLYLNLGIRVYTKPSFTREVRELQNTVDIQQIKYSVSIQQKSS